MTDAPANPMGQPTDDHRKLEPFLGTFRAEVKIWMGPGDPVVQTGTMTNSWALGGLFLRQDYTGDATEGPFPSFEGHGFWGYNTVNGKWEGVWVDNASPMMQYEVGTLDDATRTWTMLGELPNPQTGGVMTKRSVVVLHDDDRHTMEMWFAGPDGEQKAMEIRYQRSG